MTSELAVTAVPHDTQAARDEASAIPDAAAASAITPTHAVATPDLMQVAVAKPTPDANMTLPTLREPTAPLQLASTTPTPPPAAAEVAPKPLPFASMKAIAQALGIDVAEVPRLLDAASTVYAARGMSLEALVADAGQLGIGSDDARSMLIALAFPERFSAIADEAPPIPPTPEQAMVSLYVMSLLMTELSTTVPPAESMRFASVAAEKLSRLDPRDVLYVAEGMPRLINAMAGCGRIETTTAITALLHSAPETIARVVHEGHEIATMHEARALAADAHASRLDADHSDHVVRGGRGDSARADAVHEADLRGLAVAAAFITLARSESPEAARNLYARAVATADSAAPRIVLSAAARHDDDDFYERLEATLDQLQPFLDNYDRLRQQMVHVNAVPRAELCNALHVHLTRGSEQFYVALLTLLRRHAAWCTKPGTRALRTALRGRHNTRIQSGTTTWTPVELS